MRQVSHHRHVDVLAALYGDDSLLRCLAVRLEINMPVDATVGSLFFAAERNGIHQRHRPPLELVFVVVGQRSRTAKVLGRAVHFKGYTGKGILEPLFNQRYGKVRDVDAYPLPAQFLRRMSCRSAAAEGVKHKITLAARCIDNALQQRKRLLRRIAQPLLRLRVQRRDVVPEIRDWGALLFVKIAL